jgi:hypothetical protein
MAPGGKGVAVVTLRGLLTEADLAEAESEWPGLNDFLDHLPGQRRPGTFLEAVWQFERARAEAKS